MGGGNGVMAMHKAIGNAIKAKGLQKLKFYCQMCEKQCRDENGFKCHCATEAHLRQMELFRQNPDALMNDYTRQFITQYMDIMKRKGGKRVKANHVYQELIADRDHIHMNGTIFDTLSSFVAYLGKNKLCDVDQDERGDWWVKYIDRDPRVLQRQRELEQQRERESDREQSEQRRIEALMKDAMEKKRREEELREQQQQQQQPQDGPSDRSVPSRPISFSLAHPSSDAKGTLAAFDSDDDGDERGHGRGSSSSSSSSNNSQNNSTSTSKTAPVHLSSANSASSAHAIESRKRTAVDSLMQELESRKRLHLNDSAVKSASSTPASAAAAADLVDHWLHPDLVVKIMNKALGGGRFYKEKARVLRVHDVYVAEVQVLSSGERLKIDQNELETVIPSYGRPVLIVNGRHRGQRATLLRLTADDSAAVIQLDQSPRLTLDRVEFDHVCKLDE